MQKWHSWPWKLKTLTIPIWDWNTLFISPEFSFCSPLSSSAICLWTLTILFSLELFFLSSSQSIHQVTFGFLLPVLQPRNSLKAVGWDSHKVSGILLHFSWVPIHHCLRFSISKTIFFLSFFFFTYFMPRINPVLVTISWEKAEFSLKWF